MNSLESDLQSSAMTGSASDESVSAGNSGWLSDFRAIAWSLQQTAGDVASFVHRSAAAIVDEIAQIEQEEMEKQYSKNSTVDLDSSGTLRFPWEIRSATCDQNCENDFVEDLQLKGMIAELATDDMVFLGPFTDKREEDMDFLDESRIALVRRLLEVDEQLARTHARLSGRSEIREILFWKNYFYHVEKAKSSRIGLAGATDSSVLSEENDSIRPNESPKEDADDFVQVPSPPTSLNSLGVHSVNSVVVIDGPAK